MPDQSADMAALAAALALNPGAGSVTERRGTGSPEGVVTAPVGTYYTDNFGTNGAWQWVKKTGTGNTGWKVAHGDTGWRNLSALLINGWTGAAHIRRVGDQIDLRLEGINAAAATAGLCLTLPAGFKTNGSVIVRSIFYTTAMVTRRAAVFGDVTVTGYVAGDVLYGTTVATTVDAWPVGALPGT